MKKILLAMAVVSVVAQLSMPESIGQKQPQVSTDTKKGKITVIEGQKNTIQPTTNTLAVEQNATSTRIEEIISIHQQR